MFKLGGLLLPTSIGPYGYKKGFHLQAVTFSLVEIAEAGIKTSAYSSIVILPGTDPSYGATYHTPDYLK